MVEPEVTNISHKLSLTITCMLYEAKVKLKARAATELSEPIMAGVNCPKDLGASGTSFVRAACGGGPLPKNNRSINPSLPFNLNNSCCLYSTEIRHRPSPIPNATTYKPSSAFCKTYPLVIL